MATHPNRAAPLLPVLDANDRDGMVLGFARTIAGAERVAKKWAAEHGQAVHGVETTSSVRVTCDPDINAKAEADRANAAGRGWVATIS